MHLCTFVPYECWLFGGARLSAFLLGGAALSLSLSLCPPPCPVALGGLLWPACGRAPSLLTGCGVGDLASWGAEAASLRGVMAALFFARRLWLSLSLANYAY